MANNLRVEMAEHLPWALSNLFTGGMSYVLAHEAIMPSCVKLMQALLNHLLREDLMRPEEQDWLSSVKNSLFFIRQIISAQELDGDFDGSQS